MRRASRLILGLVGGALAVGLCATDLPAQPPRPKGPPPPPAATTADFRTVRGTVREYTKAPMGEVDGVVLADGTWVHWPPHLQDRFTVIAARGDRVRAAGYWETGPAGDIKLEVSALTNLGTNRVAENPDRPAPAAGRAAPGRSGDVEERLQALEDKVDRLTAEVERLRRMP